MGEHAEFFFQLAQDVCILFFDHKLGMVGAGAGGFCVGDVEADVPVGGKFAHRPKFLRLRTALDQHGGKQQIEPGIQRGVDCAHHLLV